MKPRSAKNKGRLLQVWVKDFLMSLNISKTLESGEIRSTTMGDKGEDVPLSKDARKLFPIQIECKSKAKYSVYKDYEQATKHGRFEPVVVIKQNNCKPLVVVDAEYFFRMFDEKE